MRILGVMSGTSVDAIDVALARFDVARREEFGGPDGAYDLVMATLGHAELPWSEELRADLLAAGTGAAQGAGPREWCRLHAEAGRAFGAACAQALRDLGPADLIVLHGQTLHHLVADGAVLGTLQIGAPAFVYEATGVPVLADLRSADIAAGGQGAPLASTLDALWLGDAPTAVLNLGGIANVTLVGTPGGVCAGDTGPANCLLDATAATLGLTCDVGGELAAAGRVDEAALAVLLADPYYARPLPKSTGREHFHAAYVAERLATAHPGATAPSGPDLFATLTELTARTVVDAIRASCPGGAEGGVVGVARIVASGGGVANPVLMRRLRELSGVPVLTSDDLGLPADAKEGYLMALVGWLSAHGLPGVLAGPTGAVTGARRAMVLGSLTPPHLPARVTPRDEASPVHPPRRLLVRAPETEGAS